MLVSKKDGSTVPMSHPCEIENNKIIYTILHDITSVTGKVSCEVMLVKDGVSIISSSFTFIIYNNVFTEVEEDNKTEMNVLATLIGNASDLIGTVGNKLASGDFNAGFADTMNVTTKTGEAGTAASVKVTTDESSPNTAKEFNFDFTIPKGDTGEKGEAATIEIGTVTTGEADSEASVENVGTSTEAKLNFTIPRGIQGMQGNSGTIRIGSVTTGKPNTEAKVTNSGTNTNAVLDFTLPIGEQAVRILTKEEFINLKTKEEGIIYVLSDDDTLDSLYKQEYSYKIFNDLEDLILAPSACYHACRVKGLEGDVTVFVGGNAETIQDIINGLSDDNSTNYDSIKHKSVFAINSKGEAYILKYSYDEDKDELSYEWVSSKHDPQEQIQTITLSTDDSKIKFAGELEADTTYDVLVEVSTSANSIYISLPLTRVRIYGSTPNFSPIFTSPTYVNPYMGMESYCFEKDSNDHYSLVRYTPNIRTQIQTSEDYVSYSKTYLTQFKVTFYKVK